MAPTGLIRSWHTREQSIAARSVALSSMNWAIGLSPEESVRGNISVRRAGSNGRHGRDRHREAHRGRRFGLGSGEAFGERRPVLGRAVDGGGFAQEERV